VFSRLSAGQQILTRIISVPDMRDENSQVAVRWVGFDIDFVHDVKGGNTNPVCEISWDELAGFLL